MRQKDQERLYVQRVNSRKDSYSVSAIGHTEF